MNPNQIKIHEVTVIVQSCDIEGDYTWALIGLANKKGVRYEKVWFLYGAFNNIEWRLVKYSDHQIMTTEEFNHFIEWNQADILALIKHLTENPPQV
jgi:Zn/Cd-binding protein ZinT